MSDLTLPEAFKIIQAHEPVAANALGTCDYVSCKNMKKLWVLLHHYSGGGDDDLVVTINEATSVAAGSATAITEVCPIWYNVDTASADALTRATDAITFTVDTTAGLDQLWVLDAYLYVSLCILSFFCITEPTRCTFVFWNWYH